MCTPLSTNPLNGIKYVPFMVLSFDPVSQISDTRTFNDFN